MATTKFPASAVTIDCPIAGCTGRIEVELQTGPTHRESDRIVLDVRASGFKLLDEHNHPDPWMEVPDNKGP